MAGRNSKMTAELLPMGCLIVATGGGAVIRNQNCSSRQALNASRSGGTGRNKPFKPQNQRGPAMAGPGMACVYNESFWARVVPSPAWQGGAGQGRGKRLAKLSKLWEKRKALYRNADATVSILDIAAEMGVDDLQEITSTRIALQVLEQLGAMVKERQEKDRSASYT
eukprot:jgi/Mesen1/1753/ME000014S01164